VVAKAKPQVELEPASFSVRTFAYLLAVLLLAAILVYAVQQLSRSDVLPITELRISGEFKYQDAAELKDVVSSAMQGNFFTIDVESIHQKVVQLPWVDFAWVDRIWPNVLQVRVVEEKPLALLLGHGLINRHGMVFTSDVPPQLSATVPSLDGPEELKLKMVEEFQRLSVQLQQIDVGIASLSLDTRGSWRMTLSNNIEVVLGQQGMAMRLQRFLRIYGDRLVNDKDIKRIDLRYANGFVIGALEIDVNENGWES